MGKVLLTTAALLSLIPFAQAQMAPTPDPAGDGRVGEAAAGAGIAGVATTTAPPKTITKHTAVPSPKSLKAVRVAPDKTTQHEPYLWGVDPAFMMLRRPETAPRGTVAGSADSSSVTLRCYTLEPAPVTHGLATAAPSSQQAIYDAACNNRHPSCEGNCKGATFN